MAGGGGPAGNCVTWAQPPDGRKANCARDTAGQAETRKTLGRGVETRRPQGEVSAETGDRKQTSLPCIASWKRRIAVSRMSSPLNFAGLAIT